MQASDKLYAGEYQVKMNFINPLNNKEIQSDLLTSAKFTLTATNNDQVQTISDKKGTVTLAIAIYCSLRYEGNFSAGVIAAVNHDGDSDSTGAITGNILGALVGYNAIEQKWKENLELADVILEIADDLCHGCQMSEYSPYSDTAWESKYVYAQWKQNKKCD